MDSNNPIESRGKSESPAARSKNVATLDDLPPFDLELLAVVQAWPELPDAVRAGVVALVRAASKMNFDSPGAETRKIGDPSNE